MASSDPTDLTPLTPTVYNVLLALGPEVRHGYAIMEAFEELTEGRETLLAGTLYATLSRMADAGLVTQAEAPEGERSGGPRRRYYRVTDLGRAVARLESARLSRLLELARARGLAPKHAG